MRILFVEDGRHFADAIAQVLRTNHYIVDLAHNGEDGLDCALSGIYDIIILDIMLPKMDGLTVLREIRKNADNVPVILLTAKGQTEDKVSGLDSGADDYLVKPFPTEELLARLRALGRRKNEPLSDGLTALGDITYNPSTLLLCCKNKSYRLTLKEGQLLELLLRRKGVTLSKDAIIEKIWGFESEAEDRHVEVYISFLRKKLSAAKSSVRIHTVRGAGYYLTEEG